MNDCFQNTEAQVAEHGGSVVYGWALWEWPGVMIEAEFHAVWAGPDGALVDVSPREIGADRILFVHAPGKAFEGRQVNNVRVALRDDPLIDEFIANADRMFEILNAGDRAGQFGLVEVPAAEIMPIYRRQRVVQDMLERRKAGRNDPCPCGSGRKHKRCCGAHG